jgi:acyl-CoA hydrolase
MFERHEKTLLIRPEFLNHAGTLFGGYMMKWADDMAYSAAVLTFPGTAFVTKLFGQFDFTRPVGAGDIIKVFSEVESRATTSCKVRVWAEDGTSRQVVFSTWAVMVNVRNGQKTPIPDLSKSAAPPAPDDDAIAVSALDRA